MNTLHGKEVKLNDQLWDRLNKFWFKVNEEWAIETVCRNPDRFSWKEWTTCAVCDTAIEKGGQWGTCCSRQCWRDKYL